MRRSLVIASTALAAALPGAPALAQGFSVMTQGACATAMAEAGVAAPCADGSAVLFNPAALASQPSVVSGGVSGVSLKGRFTYDYTGDQVSTPSRTQPVPFGFANFRLNDKLALGIGGFAPYGLVVEWPLEFEGRYESYKTDYRNIFIQPTLAYRIHPRLSVGVGLDYVHSSLELNQRVDLATTPTGSTLPNGTVVTFGMLGFSNSVDFANAQLKGTGHGLTFNAGITARPTDKLDLGVRYMHSTRIDYDGDATFSPVQTGIFLTGNGPIRGPNGLPLPAGTPLDVVLAPEFAAGGPLANQGISTTLELPRQLVVGLAYRPVSALRLLGDYQFTGWESFDSTAVKFEGAAPTERLILNYQNTNTYRFGADWSATPQLNVRGGFLFNTAAERATSVSPFLPEAERNEISAGLGYRTGPLGIDVAYTFIDQSDRRGRTRPLASASLSPAAVNVGVYHVDAHVLSATLAYHFGGPR